jgi:hypothetical protein
MIPPLVVPPPHPDAQREQLLRVYARPLQVQALLPAQPAEPLFVDARRQLTGRCRVGGE